MATTSGRLLALLSLLQSGRAWSGGELAERLAVSTRTLRRDVGSLRDLGYPVLADLGPDGGYRLTAGSSLPPLVLDDEQAVAVALALQTAPVSVGGLDDAAARALATLTRVMPARLSAAVSAMRVTTVRNAWDFAGPPVDAATLRTVGAAVRDAHVLRFEHLRADGSRPAPRDADFAPPALVEPHHLALWAGRWYVAARDVAGPARHDGGPGGWRVHRVDRMHAPVSTGRRFDRRDPPGGDVANFVTTSPRRDDTPARWQCTGSAVLALPPGVVARWAPGGSVVEAVDARRTRLTLGAWSWAGVAGLLATFDADLEDVEPQALRDACRSVGRRLSGA